MLCLFILVRISLCCDQDADSVGLNLGEQFCAELNLEFVHLQLGINRSW